VPARLGVGAVLALFLVFGALSPPALAQDPLVIIVVDFQRVVRESAAAATVREQIDELRNSYQAEFARIEEELRAVEAELTELRPVIADEEFVRRRRDFELRVTEAQRQAQNRRAELDRSLDEAMDRIRSSLFDVIAGIASDVEANLVLSRANVVMIDQALDFTDSALEELNELLPSVEVVVPQQ
jgi:Skp family chaperone for outer membrane proteins